jgi:hypothetical protein
MAIRAKSLIWIFGLFNHIFFHDDYPISNNINPSFIGSIQFEHSVFVDLCGAEKLTTKSKGRRCFSGSWWAIKQKIWQLEKVK